MMKRDEFQDIENVRTRVLSDGEIIRRLLRYVKPYLGELALALCLALSLTCWDQSFSDVPSICSGSPMWFFPKSF
jgi:hypothetical protein